MNNNKRTTDGVTKRTQTSNYERLAEKTRQRQFIEALEREFELSPRESKGIYEVLEAMFLEDEPLREGQVRYVAVGAEEIGGSAMSGLRKKTVVLTRDDQSDLDVERDYGRGGVRKVKLLRMTEEAYDQRTLLTQEDVGRIMGVSSRTIR